MADLPTRPDGYTILDDDWNAHVDAINANTSGISALDGRVTTVEGDIAAHDSRLNDLETGHAARYYLSTDQSGILNGTDTRVPFDTAQFASPDITASGTGNTTFTLNRTGIWAIDVGLRGGGVTFTGTPTGERLLAITNGGTAFSDRFVSHNDFVGSGELFSRPLSVCRWFNAGDQVSVTYKHFSGNDDGWVNGQGQGEQTCITLLWHRA